MHVLIRKNPGGIHVYNWENVEIEDTYVDETT